MTQWYLTSRQLSQRFLTHFELGHASVKFAESIFEGLEKRQIEIGTLSALQEYYVSGFYRATESLRALALLCDGGYTQDARTVSRKILETTVHMKWVSLDPDRNFETLDYSEKHRLVRMIDRHNKVDWTRNISAETARRLRPEIQEALKRRSKAPARLPELWEMMKMCGIAEDVLSAYNIFCIPTRSGISSTDDYSDGEKGKFKSGSDETDVPDLLLTAVYLHLPVAELVLDEFAMDDLRPPLAQLRERLRELDRVAENEKP
jgi:hypothetical protein